jgi:hypothetical protein
MQIQLNTTEVLTLELSGAVAGRRPDTVSDLSELLERSRDLWHATAPPKMPQAFSEGTRYVRSRESLVYAGNSVAA